MEMPGGEGSMLGSSERDRARIAPREEQLMLKSFGDDHRKYMEQTYRLVPGIY